MGFRAQQRPEMFQASQESLNQLSPGVRSIFATQAPFQTRPQGESSFDQTQGVFGGVGQGLAQEANRTGLNPFTRLKIGQARQASQSGAAKAAGQLASQGGLRSGALERLRSSAQGQGLDAQTNLAIADEQNRLNALKANTGIDAQRAGALAQAGQFDINQGARERATLNTFNLAERDALRGSLAAEQQAQAIAAGGEGGGGLFGTGLEASSLDPRRGIFGNSTLGQIANVGTLPVRAPFEAIKSIF